LQSPIHVITTARRKQDYALTNDSSGKLKVEKAGTKEVTREGYEYELTLNFELINDQHLAKASKDRTGLFMNEAEFIITSETGKTLLNWANSGEDNNTKVITLLKQAKSREELEKIVEENPVTIREPQVTEVLKEMGKKYPKELNKTSK